MSGGFNYTQENVIEKLNKAVASVSINIKDYCKNPDKDFVRNRKLGIKTLLHLMLSMEGQSLNAELYDKFDCREERPTSSAYVQQRKKLKPEVFKAILNEFNSTLVFPKRKNGYRIMAIDGSDFATPYNPDSAFYGKSGAKLADGTDGKGVCLMHTNMVYDILNRQFIDCTIDENERSAAINMIKSCKTHKTLFIMDRGYAGFNMFEHCIRSGHKFLIRVANSRFGFVNELPDCEIDKDVTVKLTTTQKKEYLKSGYIHLNVRKKDRGKTLKRSTKYTRWDFEEVCEQQLRVVKVKINDPDSGKEVFETLVTNLDRFTFPIAEIKKLYHLRWDIETAFRGLKYDEGTVNFHSRQDEFVIQELFAHLVMFNARRRVAMQVADKTSASGQVYRIEFKMAVHIFRQFFRKHNNDPPDELYADISRYWQPVREGRKDKRNMRTKTAVWFVYRVA